MFRLVEFGGGVYSSVTTHIQSTEAYQYIFDSTLMFFAMVVIHHPHPGTLLVGDDAEPPYGKAKRATKSARKEERRRLKAAKKQAKSSSKIPGATWADGLDDIELGPYVKLESDPIERRTGR